MLFSEAKVQYQLGANIFNIGLQAQYQQLGSEKQAFRLTDRGSELLPASLFSGRQLTLSYHKWAPYLSHTLLKGKLRVEQQWGLGLMSFPDSNAQSSQNILPEFMLGGSIDGFVNVSLNFKQSLSAFPLAALMYGYDLRDFRQVTLTRQTGFEPRPERSYAFSVYKNMMQKGLLLSLSVAHGRTFKGEQFLTGLAPFVAGFYNQLPAGFHLAEIQADKQFKKTPLQIKTSHGLIQNYMENVLEDSGESYRVIIRRMQHELNFLYKTKETRVGYDLKNKFSQFSFRSDLTSGVTKQYMLSSVLGLYAELLSKRNLLVEPGLRYVRFLGAERAQFTNLTCQLRYSTGKMRYFLEGDNLLNNRTFVRQDQQPLFLNTDTQFVFARYVRAGVNWTIN